MPYSVITRDGIQINNIPDNISQDSDQLRQRVEQARQDASNQGLFGQQSDQPKILKEGEGSDFFRGIGQYKDQFGGILGGAKVLAGKATGSDDLIKSGLADMDESERKIGARGVKETDEFTKALDKGLVSVLTEFVPFVAGQGVGMIGEALVTSIAGSMIGSAVAPGAGTVSGALTGFVGKELVKKGLIDKAKDLTKDELRKEVGDILQSEVGKQAIKDIYKKAGSKVALTGMAGKFGAGEVTGRAVDEAIKDIEDPELQLEKIKELSTSKLAALSTAHALADYIGIKIGLGSLDKLAKPTQSLLLNIAKNIGITGIKEAPVEAVQTALERYGADLPLDDRAALEEYINAAAAGFAMPIVPATIGGIRSTVTTSSNDSSDPEVSSDPKPKGPEPTPPDQPSSRKGWEYEKAEVKRREDNAKARENADLAQSDIDNIDLDNADIVIPPEPELQQDDFKLPSIQEIEKSTKEKQDELLRAAGQPEQSQQDADRRGVSIPESEPTISGEQLPDTQRLGEVVGGPMDSPAGDVSPVIRGTGALLSALGPAREGFERIQTGTQDVVIGTDKDGNPITQQMPLFTDRPIDSKMALEELEKDPIQQRLDLGEVTTQSLRNERETGLFKQRLKRYLEEQIVLNKSLDFSKAEPYSITPDGLAESEAIYNHILKTEGRRAADTYLKNKRDSNELFDQTVVDTESNPTDQENALPLYASSNLTSISEFVTNNNLDDYYINHEESVGGQTIAYTVRQKSTLPNTDVSTVTDFLLRDKGRNLNKTSNPLAFGETVAPESVEAVLRKKLTKAQFDVLNSDKKNFEKIANEYTKKAANQGQASTPALEIKTRAKRAAKFDAYASRIKDYPDFVNKLKSLKLRTIPTFLKTGSVEGVDAPFVGATSMDQVIRRAIGDYIFEEAADSQSTPSTFGSGQNVDKKDKARRKKIRDEFINSAIVADYISRDSRYNSIADIKNDIGQYKSMFKRGGDYTDKLANQQDNKDLLQEARDLVTEIDDLEQTLLAEAVNQAKDKQELKKIKDKLKKTAKNKIQEENIKLDQAAINKAIDEMSIDSDIDSAIDIINEIPAAVNPFNVAINEAFESRGDEQDVVKTIEDAFSDGSENDVQYLIRKNENDTVGLIKELENYISSVIDLLMAQLEEAKASGDTQEVQRINNNIGAYGTLGSILNKLKSVPGMKALSTVVLPEKEYINIFSKFRRVTKEDKSNSAGFYTPSGKTYNEIVKIFGKVVSVPVKYDVPGAKYDQRIVLRKSNGQSTYRTLKVLVHELTHAATVDGMINIMTDSEQVALSRMLESARREAFNRGEYTTDKDGKIEYDLYGLSDPFEFIAEAFSNPRFQKFLTEIPSIESQGYRLPEESNIFKSMFDTFTEWVSELLGLGNIDNTLLKDTFRVSERLFNAGMAPNVKFEPERMEVWKKKQRFRNYTNKSRKPLPPGMRALLKAMYPENSIHPSINEDKKSSMSDDNIKLVSEIVRIKSKQRPRKTLDEIQNDNIKLYKEQTRSSGNRLKNSFSRFFKNGDEGLTNAIRNFANRSIDIKKLQDKLERSGLLLAGVEGFNNVFDQLTRAFGLSDFYMKQLQPSMDNYSNSLGEYLKLQEQRGLSEEDAKGILKTIFTGLHEGERREVKYLLDVPLSNEKIIKKGNTTTSPSELRAEIMNVITTKVWKDSKQKIADLEKYKNMLRRLANPNTRFSGKLSIDSVAGVSYFSNKKGGPADITNSRYNVSEMSHEDANAERQKFEILKNRDPELYNVINKFRESMDVINKETLRLNQEANYASPQALNIIQFYGWKNYIPFKKSNNWDYDSTSESFYNPTGGRLSRELKKLESSFEGNEGETSDPIVQVVVDASRAAARAGRINYTQSIYNAVTQTVEYTDPITGKQKRGKAIDGKVLNIYSYEQRYTNDEGLQKDIEKKNTVLHFLDDGSIAVIEIKDEKLVEAIRGSYADNPQFVAFMNRMTGFLGQLHTRFNPPFATLNFVRDAITNIFYISADLGIKDMGGYLQRIAKTITNGGFIRVAKVMNMYTKGRIKELEAYVASEKAKGQTLPESMYEYLQNGGMISYSQALSIETAYERLQENYARSQKGIAKNKQTVKDFFDVWMSTFELTTRAAAYQTHKENYLTQNAPGRTGKQIPADIERAAIERSVVYAKRLSNFEERGIYGDFMGAWFMFFRPSAVGIVRAFESMDAALQRKDVAESNLPDIIKGNPEALENWSRNFDKRRKAAYGMAAAGVGMGYAVWHMAAMLGDDDDNKTREDDPARWTRFARFDISWIPGFEKGDVLQLPWGFGPGGFAAIGAQLAAYGGADKYSMSEMIANISNITLDSFMPLPFSRMSPIEHPFQWALDTAMPSVAKPIFEYTMNMNAFGQNIYNPLQTRKYGSAYGGSDNVAELYKDISIGLAEMSNGAIDWSPNVIAFFANNYGDAVGRVAHDLYGLGLTLKGDKQFDPKRDTVFFDSFISKYSNIEQREYADAVRKVDELNRKINLFKETNPIKYSEILSQFPAGPIVIKDYNTLKADLDELNEQAKTIRKMPGLTAKERKLRLDPIKDQILMYKRTIANMVELGLASGD